MNAFLYTYVSLLYIKTGAGEAAGEETTQKIYNVQQQQQKQRQQKRIEAKSRANVNFVVRVLGCCMLLCRCIMKQREKIFAAAAVLYVVAWLHHRINYTNFRNMF
jgi:hypothetical protein